MKRLLFVILKTSAITIGLLLFLSVLWNGARLIIDNDEFSHAHMTYWIANGLVPYRDYYASVYTPIFHWFLLPVFSLAGFQPETFPLMRLVMVCVFMLRLMLLYVLTKIVLGRRIGVFAVLLYLLDPFTTITAMQIRPDNLMLVLLLGGIVLLLWVHEKNKDRYTVSAGIFAGLSLLAMAKIAPSILALALGLFIAKGKVAKRVFLHWALGIILVASLLFIALSYNKILPQFVIQAVTNSAAFYGAHRNLTALGYFYQPNNNVLYGYPGKPLTWIYVQALPIFAVGGWCYLLLTRLRNKHTRPYNGIVLGLLIMLPLQWAALTVPQSVFIQYYIPLTYLFAIFAAVAIDKLFNPFSVVWYVVFVYVAVVGIRGNLLRVRYYGNTAQIASLTTLYRTIPQEAKVFPVGLFRPMTYPLWYGLFWGDIPTSIKKQFPAMLPILDQPDVTYVLTNEYEIRFYPPEVKKYILTHFQPIPGKKNLWARKK